MTRRDRFRSALTFLCWGCFSFGVVALLAFGAWGLKMVSQNNVIFLAIILSLTLWTIVCLAAGLYLLVRVII
jgi:hypothetical protein